MFLQKKIIYMSIKYKISKHLKYPCGVFTSVVCIDIFCAICNMKTKEKEKCNE